MILVSPKDDSVSVGIYCRNEVAGKSISAVEHNKIHQGKTVYTKHPRSKKERWTSVFQPGELMQLILEGKMDGNRGGGRPSIGRLNKIGKYKSLDIDWRGII